MIFKPDKAAIDVIIIGPKNHAKGIFKYSAIIALGKEIIKTENKQIEIQIPVKECRI